MTIPFYLTYAVLPNSICDICDKPAIRWFGSKGTSHRLFCEAHLRNALSIERDRTFDEMTRVEMKLADLKRHLDDVAAEVDRSLAREELK